MGDIVEEDHLGLFIGLTSIPIYSNEKFNISNFKRNVVDETFIKFRSELENSIRNKEQLDDKLYKAINFYAFGFFPHIFRSLLSTDDFYTFYERREGRKRSLMESEI